MDFPARFYDGITPAPQSVRIAVTGPLLIIADAQGREIARWILSDLRVPGQDDSIGEAMILSRAMPDARLLISDPQAIAALKPHLPTIVAIVAPRPSSKKIWTALTVLAAVVLVGVVTAIWQGPALLAPLIPQSWERGLGDQIAEAISSRYGVCNTPEGDAALQTIVDTLVGAAKHKHPVKVVVVKSKIVNALALPGGRMIFFDGLIQEAESPDEVAGVMAHELGHVVNRHPMRGVLRQLGLGVLRRMALGGYGDAVDNLSSMGEMMLALSNGRNAEREADAAALEYLAAAGLRQDGLSGFFARMQKEENEKKGKRGEFRAQILSTHPDLAERLQSTQRSTAGRSALTSEQWKALRNICSSSTTPTSPFSSKP